MHHGKYLEHCDEWYAYGAHKGCNHAIHNNFHGMVYEMNCANFAKEASNIITRETKANDHHLVIYAISADGIYVNGACIVTMLRLK